VTQSSLIDSDQHSLQRFIWLLNQRGYRFWPEDKLCEVISVRNKKPDFYVRAPGHDFLAEVESFEKRLPRLGQAMSGNPAWESRRILTAVRHAAQQLRDYAHLNLPTVVVLDNWRRIGLPTDIGTLWAALFTPQGRGQPLLNSNNKRNVSAVAWNLPKTRPIDEDAINTEPPMCVRVLHNPYADIPLCSTVFGSTSDEHYRISQRGRPIRF